ncbi:hypothetical protein AGMMS50276_16840 [Synergistales bacterium]|nr:hypothetical protein AGMMS50276_16840 [Synergistales bacterium]
MSPSAAIATLSLTQSANIAAINITTDKNNFLINKSLLSKLKTKTKLADY